MAVSAQVCHHAQAAETVILWGKLPREPAAVCVLSLLVHCEILNLRGSPKKGAKPYKTNCLPLVGTSISACQLWATALVSNTVLVEPAASLCFWQSVRIQNLTSTSQKNGSEGKMLRQKLVFYHGKGGVCCVKRCTKTPEKDCVSGIAWHRRMRENGQTKAEMQEP